MEILVEGLEEAFCALLQAFEQGTGVYDVSPRGQKSRDLVDCQLVIENPRDRLIFNPIRNIEPAAIIGETLWYLRGSNSLEEIAYYIPKMRDFSDDGNTVNSAYGVRLRLWFATLVSELKRDPDSKRVILPILSHEDMGRMSRTKDFPCTAALHFFMRGGRLHATASMRAQDVFWGLQHDVFFFTFLQEIVALTLGVPLGTYRHVVSMFNLYERHYEKAKAILEQPETKGEPLPPLSSLEELEELIRQEPVIRKSPELGNLRGLRDPLLEDFRRILLHKRTKDGRHLQKLETQCFRKLLRVQA